VQKHKKKHQHLIVIMISKYNTVEDTQNRKKRIKDKEIYKYRAGGAWEAIPDTGTQKQTHK